MLVTDARTGVQVAAAEGSARKADLKLGIAGGTLEIAGIPLKEARCIRSAILDSIVSVDFSRLPG